MSKRLMIVISILAIALLAFCACSIGGENKPEESLPPPPEFTEDLTVYCFKAGKADAHLIYNSKFAVLIDCGEKGFGKEIVQYLGNAGIKKLDLLVITHFDKDHVGGAAKVLKSVEIGQVIQSNCPKNSTEYEEYTAQLKASGITPLTLRERRNWRFEGADITIDPPARETYNDEPSNNSSLISTVRCGECSLLFAGDAEDIRLSEFMKTAKGGFTFLKVPYHGRLTKRSVEFIRYASPMVAVITCSDEMQEDPKVAAALKEAGSAVYLTREAPVVVKCDGKTVSAFYDR